MKTFQSVSSMKLATLKEGQFVETGGYYSAGDGGGARYLIATPQAADEFGDHTLANGNVAVLQQDSHAINPLQFGADRTGATDTLANFNAALAAGSKVFVPAGDYKISDTLYVPELTWLDGVGRDSNFVADNITGLAVSTYDGVDTGVSNSHNISNINVSGVATAAFGFVHSVLGTYRNLSIKGFTGQDGFVWENTYSCVYDFLTTAGATISSTCFKFNKVVLDTIVNLPYSSNICPYNFVLDRSITEYSNTTSNSHRNIQINTPTAQGATVTGLYIRQYSNVLVSNLYTENCELPVRVGDSSEAGRQGLDIAFVGGSAAGVTGTSTQQVLIDQCSGLTWQGGAFGKTTDIVLGDITSVHFEAPRLTSNADITTVLKRTASAASSLPFSCVQTLPTGTQHLVKTDNNQYRLGVMTVDGLGAWSSTNVFNVPLA